MYCASRYKYFFNNWEFFEYRLFINLSIIHFINFIYHQKALGANQMINDTIC